MKLALLYDWLFYSGEKDNIMNIGKLTIIVLNCIVIALNCIACHSALCKYVVHYIGAF